MFIVMLFLIFLMLFVIASNIQTEGNEKVVLYIVVVVVFIIYVIIKI